MARPDDRLERQIATYRRVTQALGPHLICLAIYGSAAGSDFFQPNSDVNVTVVVPTVSIDVLEALAPVVMRWDKRRFATPLLIERDFLDRARDAFPMELDDIRRQHRLLAGTDVLSAVTKSHQDWIGCCAQTGCTSRPLRLPQHSLLYRQRTWMPEPIRAQGTPPLRRIARQREFASNPPQPVCGCRL
jgi:hypothetical protein